MLYAVQDANGREVVFWKGDVDKVSEVEARAVKGHVELVRGEEILARNDIGDRDPATFRFLRWPADDKLAQPVTHKVT
jgi:hypothetical protein